MKKVVSSLSITAILVLTGCGDYKEPTKDYKDIVTSGKRVTQKASLYVTDIKTNADGSLTLAFSDGRKFKTDSLKGQQGIQGDKGKKGDTGTQGIQGLKGDAIKVTNITTNDDGTLTLNFSDGTSHKTSSLKGDTGSQGIQGVQGLKGNVGSQGIKGNTGKTIGVKSIKVNDNGTLTMTFSDDSTFTTTKSIIASSGTESSLQTTVPFAVTGITPNDNNGTLTISFSDGTTKEIPAAVGIQDISLENNGSLAIKLTNNTTFYTASVKGKDGVGTGGNNFDVNVTTDTNGTTLHFSNGKKAFIPTTSSGTEGVGSEIISAKIEDNGTLTLAFKNGSVTTDKSIIGPKGNPGIQGEKGEAGDPAVTVIEHDSIGWNKTIPIVNNTQWDKINTQNILDSNYRFLTYLEEMDAYAYIYYYGYYMSILKLNENGKFDIMRTLRFQDSSKYGTGSKYNVHSVTITPDGKRIFQYSSSTDLYMYEWSEKENKYVQKIKQKMPTGLDQSLDSTLALKTDYTGTHLLWGKYLLKVDKQGRFVSDKLNTDNINMENFLGATATLDLIWTKEGKRVKVYQKQSDSSWTQQSSIIPKDGNDFVNDISSCIISGDIDHSKAILVAAVKDKPYKVYTFYKKNNKWIQADVQAHPNGGSQSLANYGVSANIDFSKMYTFTQNNTIDTYQAKRDNNITAKKDPFNDGSLVAKYMLDGNTNDLLAKYNGSPISLSYIDGKYKKSAQLSDSSEISIKDINLSKEYSFSLWYKDCEGIALSWGDNYIDLNTDGYVYLNIDGTKNIDKNSENKKDNWIHLTLIIKENKATLYQNGFKKKEFDISSKGFKGTLYIGRNKDGSQGLFGSLDQVEIYNRALNISEVYRLHEAQ